MRPKRTGFGTVGHASLEKLRPRVLEVTSDLQINSARSALGTFLVLQSESAACERVFARAEFIRKNVHEQRNGQLVEQYLWLGQGPPVAQACQIAARGVRLYMDAKEQRSASNPAGRVYTKGRRIKISRHKQRDDAGTTGVPSSVFLAGRCALHSCCELRSGLGAGVRMWHFFRWIAGWCYPIADAVPPLPNGRVCTDAGRARARGRGHGCGHRRAHGRASRPQKHTVLVDIGEH